jgi:class 3 adenylate cyclase
MVFSIIKALRIISRAAKENELLLLNILPSSIANRLKEGEELIADEYPQASVLFSDIVGFTAMTSQIGTTKMVDILGHLFDEFDLLASQYGVEKIKTIGDNYMAVAGVPVPAADHAIRLANFALAMKEKVKEFAQQHNIQLQMRTGMTYGAVIAGVIGHKKFIYDVWGDVVNTASRMESTGVPGEIQITEKMALLLEDQFIVEARSEIEVKGKGLMKTYLLKGKRPPATLPDPL